MISSAKIRLLHVARRKLEIADDEYREILNRHANVRSSTELTDESFKAVLDHFKLAYGFSVRRRWEQSRPSDPDAVVTPGQLRILNHLWLDIVEYLPGANHAPYRRAFYVKLEMSPLGPQSRREASRLIEILKSRLQREMKKKLAATDRADAKPDTVLHHDGDREEPSAGVRSGDDGAIARRGNPMKCLGLHVDNFTHFDPGIESLEKYDLGLAFTYKDPPTPITQEPRLYLYISVRQPPKDSPSTIYYARLRSDLRGKGSPPDWSADVESLKGAVLKRLEADTADLVAGKLRTSEEEPIFL